MSVMLQPHLAVGHVRLVLCVGVSVCVRVMVPQAALGAGLTFQPWVDPTRVGRTVDAIQLQAVK